VNSLALGHHSPEAAGVGEHFVRVAEAGSVAVVVASDKVLLLASAGRLRVALVSSLTASRILILIDVDGRLRSNSVLRRG